MPFFSSTRLFGFSTGALAQSDWRRGLELCRETGVEGVELSALRLPELQPLINAADTLNLSAFSYVSLHLPSRFSINDESNVFRCAEQIANKNWPLVVHPDVISDWDLWSELGRLVCIENMDKRKSKGRTLEELSFVFDRLPEATFCFDFGHARQVDPTMSQAARILHAFGSRLVQVHLSDVDSSNKHRVLNFPALTAFGRVSCMIPPSVPIILETTVDDYGPTRQLELAKMLFFDARPHVFNADSWNLAGPIAGLSSGRETA